MAYDYREAMADDIKQYIDENVTIDDNGYTYNGEVYTDGQELYDALTDDLWVDDSVTGNGSGSYTMNREEAKGYVVDNMELVVDVMNEFGIESDYVGKRLLEQDWEYFDVSIRCYLLGEILAEILSELGVEY